MKNILLRTSMLILVLAVCLSVFSMAGDISYNDTDGHWAENAINRWTGYGVVAGDGVSFSPEAPLTRAMMATIISNTHTHQYGDRTKCTPTNQ